MTPPSTQPSEPRVLGVVPARWASSRFPGKPLHLIAGKPLVQHVWERCRRASRLHDVIVATDDSRIADAASAFGATVQMTSPDHASGTDRIAEVARRRPAFTHLVNIQGDEPLISPRLVNRLADTLLAGPGFPMVTAANPLPLDHPDLHDPNVVKVVLDRHRRALYFSRSLIPFPRIAGAAPLPAYRHHGIYGYTREFLLQFVRWRPSPLERCEQLEQLRALENGAAIAVIVTKHASVGIDTPRQAAILNRQLAE